MQDQLDPLNYTGTPPRPPRAPTLPPTHILLLGLFFFAAGIASYTTYDIHNKHDRINALNEQVASAKADALSAADEFKVTIANLRRQTMSIDEHTTQNAGTLNHLNLELQHRTDLMLRAESFPITGKKQPSAQGRLFWDKSSRAWLLIASNVRPNSPGKAYQLWLVTPDGKRIPSISAAADAAGKVTFQLPLPENLSPIAAEITEEPARGLDAPTGPLEFLAPLSP